MSGSRTNVVQLRRTLTPGNSPVAGSLLDGELQLELGGPVRMWAGVPTSIDASGRVLIYDSATSFNIPEAPADGPVYGRQPGVWQPVLPIAGGTLTGPLTISPSTVTNALTLTQGHIHLSAGNVVVAGTGQAQIGGTSLLGNSSAAWTAVFGAATNPIIQAQGTAGGSLLVRGQGGAGGVSLGNPTTGNVLSALPGVGGTTASDTLTIRQPVTTGGEMLMSKSGGGGLTLQMMLTLQAAPTVPLHAATKAYVDLRLPLTGGTLTGALTLPGDPTTGLQAATKQYVDNAITASIGLQVPDAPSNGSSYGRRNAAWVTVLPLTGGRLTGALVVGPLTPASIFLGSVFANYGSASNGLSVAAYMNAANSAWLHAGATLAAAVLTTTATALQVNVAAPGTADSSIGSFTTYTLGTNGIFVAPSEVQSNVFRLTTGGGYFFSTATVTQIAMDTSTWRWEYTRNTGQMDYVRGSDNIKLFSVDPGGNVYGYGTLNAPTVNASSAVISAGNVYARGGYLVLGPGDRMRVNTDGSTYSAITWRDDNWRLQWSWADGSMNFYNASSARLWYVDGSGGMGAANNILSVGGGVFSLGTDFGFYQSGGARYFQFGGQAWCWQWNTANGDMIWYQAGVVSLVIRSSDALIYNNRAPMAGHGAYIDLNSDEREKADITPAPVGLDTILAIDPIRYRSKAGDPRMKIGFSAQNLRKTLPEAVIVPNLPFSDGSEDADDPRMGITTDPVTAALVNAVKELTARLEHIESFLVI